MIPAHQILVLSDPKIVQKVLSSTHPAHLNKPAFLYKLAVSDELNDALGISEFDIWSLHRNVISSAFKYNCFPNFLKIMNEEGKCIVKSACDTAVSGRGWVDNEQFKKLLEHHATKVIAKIMIGSESTNIPDQEWDQLHANLSRGKVLSTYRFLRPPLWFPPLWSINKNKMEMDHLVHSTREFLLKVANKYRIKSVKEEKLDEDKNASLNNPAGKSANPNADIKSTVEDVNSEKSSVDTTSASVMEYMIKAGLSNKAIVDELKMFMFAGQETVVIAMNFLLFHLASNVKIQRNCQDEILRLIQTHKCDEHGNFALDHLSELKYLERCILESLRMSPPIPAFMRRIDKDLDIDEEYMIEAGQYVMIVPWGVHRNPKDFPNPEVFDPDRFLLENVKKRHSHSFIPFSMGSRNCIGWKVALLEMKVMTSWILRYFDLTTNDRPNDIKIQFGLGLAPERPFDLKFSMRT